MARVVGRGSLGGTAGSFHLEELRGGVLVVELGDAKGDVLGEGEDCSRVYWI